MQLSVDLDEISIVTKTTNIAFATFASKISDTTSNTSNIC